MSGCQAGEGRYLKYLGYRDTQGRVWKNRRPNGWPNDDKAPDGFTVNGYRIIDKRRRIRFSGSYWTHEKFEPGRVVHVQLHDPFGAKILAVLIDTKWSPDNICDESRAFMEHSWDFAHSALRPDYAGDWAKRIPR